MSVGVLGAGAFGTALAISLSHTRPVLLWSRDSGHVSEMQSQRANKRRLGNAEFPDALSVTKEISDLGSLDTLLLAVPMQKLRGVLRQFAPHIDRKTLVACCKGIELSSACGPVQIIETEIPTATAAILTGPSFARDIAAGLPTALTLACQDTSASARLQAELTTDNLRLYRTTDTVGAELGGALKNVVAIACGTTIGAGLGESARAALMTRGYSEMKRMAENLGAERDTLAGLAGFGDLALTCTSEQSRNYQLGLSIGRGIGFDPGITVEGAATARAVLEMARVREIDMPITEAVVQLLDKKIDIRDAMAQLLARPLKEE